LELYIQIPIHFYGVVSKWIQMATSLNRYREHCLI